MACKEFVRGLVQSGAGVAGTGTVINIDALFPAAALLPINEITVFNDGSAAVKVEYKNDNTGYVDSFIVPNGGKSYTHKLSLGNIVPTSIKVYSLTATAVTGNITINLAGNRS